MKKILPWLKSNLIPVIAVALALIAAPVMLCFSFGWSANIHKDVETKVSQDIASLDAIDVTYKIEPYLSGLQPVQVRATPNEATTNAVAKLLQAVTSESQEVRGLAVQFNSNQKALLIDGPAPSDKLFPHAADESTKLRLLDRLVATWPKAHAELLKQSRALMPPSQDQVRAALEQVRKQEEAKGVIDRKELAETLGTRRLEIYRRDARATCFYASTDIFKGVSAWDITKVLPIDTAWEWQQLYWIHQDIIRAVSLANSDEIHPWLPVFEAPVKRIESIVVRRPGETDKAPSAFGGSGGAPAPAPVPAPAGAGDTAELPRSYTLAHTGRVSAPTAPNPIYDIRNVELSVIVSSTRLPRLLEAFPKTNFMTVVDLDLQDFDPLPALRQGFDYGSDHLVRADIKIETLWLRSWTRASMPAGVRKTLGIPDEPGQAPAESAQPASAALPPRQPPPPPPPTESSRN